MVKSSFNTRDPEARAKIIEQYEKYGEEWTRSEYGVDRKQISRWRQLFEETGSYSPRFQARGRSKELSPREIAAMERALLRDPFLTNADLAAVVGNKITARAAGNYIRNSRHRFVSKLEQQDVEKTFTAANAREGEEFAAKIRRIPLAKRVYVDETFVSAGIRRRHGRYPSGVAAWTPKNRKYPRKTIIGALRLSGFVHAGVVFNKGSITTGDFVHYVEHTLAPLLHGDEVVLWDQLGRSGRALNPTALHFSPEARVAIEARGASLQLLPSYGKLFDPIEMVFGDVKRIFDKDFGRLVLRRLPSSISFPKIRALWRSAESKVGAASIKRAFKERANGQEFSRVCREKGLHGQS